MSLHCVPQDQKSAAHKKAHNNQYTSFMVELLLPYLTINSMEAMLPVMSAWLNA